MKPQELPMSRSLLLIAVSVLISFSYATAGDVPFTPAGIASLKGRNICELQGKFYSKVGVYLDGRKEHAVEYLSRDGITVVFLLGEPLSENCGIVDAVLDLTPLIKSGENAEFKCHTDTEGGSTWAKWGHVIGLADNQRGRKRFVTARLAWRVNIPGKRFEPISKKPVRCDTTGYED
jgi:hypothetical protein